MKKIGNLRGMKKVMLTLVFGIFLLTLVNASSYIGTQYEDVNLIETCVVNGFPCPSDFLCNITIINPERDVIVLNSPMERNDTIYNYTFVSTDLLGDYDINVYCGNLTLSGNAESKLEITTTGRAVNPTLVIIILVVALVLFLIALWVKNHAMGFISGILFVLSGMYIMIYGLTYVADMYTRSIALVTIAFGSFVALVAGYEWLGEMSQND